jgi:hypothetical protein
MPSSRELTEQTRRAVELAQADPAIRRAVADAPPLSPETMAHVRRLVPPLGTHRLPRAGGDRRDDAS